MPCKASAHFSAHKQVITGTILDQLRKNKVEILKTYLYG